MNSKWIRSLKLIARTIKILEEDMGPNFCDRGLSNGVLDVIPKAHVTKQKIDKLKFIKHENFCVSKHVIRKVKSILWYGRKYLQLFLSSVE